MNEKIIWRAYANSSAGKPIFIDQKGWLFKLICESSVDCELLIHKSRKVYEENTPITQQVLDRITGKDKMMEELFHHAYIPKGNTLEITDLLLSTPLELRPRFISPGGNKIAGELKVVAYVRD